MENFAEQGELISGKKPTPGKRSMPTRIINNIPRKVLLRPDSIITWSDISKTPEEIALKHPEMFPTQLVSRLIEWFTGFDQTVVLDPFSGIGSSVLAAEKMGKTGIGLELSADYISKARNRPP